MAAKILSIAFPFQSGDLAFPALATDDAAILASVIQILTTAPGERVMRPLFGSNSFSYVFENDGPDFRATVEREVRQALATWEPRIRVEDVSVESADVAEPGLFTIDVTYTILASGNVTTISVAGGS